MGAKSPEGVREAFLEAVRSGEMKPPEAAKAAGISRATGYRWLEEAGVDWERARRDYVNKLWAER